MITYRRLKQIVLTLAISAFFVLSGTSLAQGAQTPANTQGKNATAKPKQLDINSASKDELKALPGINDAYSQKIIDGRPYGKKIELVSRGILPKIAYDKIGMLVTVKKPTKPAPGKKPS